MPYLPIGMTTFVQPLDLEISFESLEIDKRGGLFVPKKSQKKELSIRLATRISPEE